jgi:hypothetical protein
LVDIAEGLLGETFRQDKKIQGLRWDEVDMQNMVIRLSANRSKNREARTLAIKGPLVAVMKRRAALAHGLPYVFTRFVKKRNKHVRIQQWGKVWRNATTAAGCEGLILHDLRRTVVRGLTRAGIPEKLAMGWTGHKTRSVFDRYDIVNEADLQAAADQFAAYQENASKKPSEPSSESPQV